MPPLPPVRNDKLRVEWGESKSAGQVLQEVIQRRCEWGDVNVGWMRRLLSREFKAKTQYMDFARQVLTSAHRHPNVLEIVKYVVRRAGLEYPQMRMPVAILDSVPTEAGRGVEVILKNIAIFFRFQKDEEALGLRPDEWKPNLVELEDSLCARIQRSTGNPMDSWMACMFDKSLEVYWAGRGERFLQRRLAPLATKAYDSVQPHSYDAQTLCYVAYRYAKRDGLHLESEETLPGLGEEQVPYQWNGDLFTVLNPAASIPQLLQHLHAQTTFLGLKYAWPIPVFSAEQRRALNSSDEQLEQAGWLYATVELLERKIAETELICQTPGDLWTQQVCRMMSSHMSRTRFSDVQTLHVREWKKPAIGTALYTPPAPRGELPLPPIRVVLKAQKVRTQWSPQSNGGVPVGRQRKLDVNPLEALDSIAQRVQARHEFYLAAVTVNRLLETEAHGGFARVLGTFDCDCSADHPFGAVWVCPDDSLENQSSWSYVVYEHIGKADAVRSATLEELRLSQQTLLSFFAGMSKPQIAVELVNACLIAMLNLLAAQARFDFSHGDIHNKNIMLVETREEHEYTWTLQLPGRSYPVSIRSKYRPVFIDFGRSFGRLPELGKAIRDCEPIGDPLGQWEQGTSAVQSSAVYDQKNMVRVLREMVQVCGGSKDDSLRVLTAELDSLLNVDHPEHSRHSEDPKQPGEKKADVESNGPDHTAVEVFMTGDWQTLPQDIVLLCLATLHPETPGGSRATPARPQHTVPADLLVHQWRRMHRLWEKILPLHDGLFYSGTESRLWGKPVQQEPQKALLPRLDKIETWFGRINELIPPWMRLLSQQMVLHAFGSAYPWAMALQWKSVTRKMSPARWKRLQVLLLTGIDESSELGQLGRWYLTKPDPQRYEPGQDEVYID